MSNPTICPKCYHRPSGRYAEYGDECQCKCHDVADAGSELLAALRQIAELEGDCEQQVFRLTRFQAAQIARAAILKAEGGPT